MLRSLDVPPVWQRESICLLTLLLLLMLTGSVTGSAKDRDKNRAAVSRFPFSTILPLPHVWQETQATGSWQTANEGCWSAHFTHRKPIRRERGRRSCDDFLLLFRSSSSHWTPSRAKKWRRAESKVKGRLAGRQGTRVNLFLSLRSFTSCSSRLGFRSRNATRRSRSWDWISSSSGPHILPSCSLTRATDGRPTCPRTNSVHISPPDAVVK